MAKTKAAQVVLTAKDLLSQNQEDQDKVMVERKLQDAQIDLERAVQDAERELFSLIAQEEQALKDFILNGEGVETLLNPSRDLSVVKSDIYNLKRILEERF